MRISKKRRAEMWCELNSWKTPKELEGKFNPENKAERAIEMKKIVKDIGLDYCLKIWQEKHCKEENNANA